MKKIALLLLFFTAFATVHGQNEVKLLLTQRLNNAVFSLNQVIDHPSGPYQLKYTRFEYYISDLKITHDGGQITPATGVHLLVRPALDSLYSLGQMPNVQSVEAITFAVGVEKQANHLDPTTYPADDPLAPQNPSMHWGWAPGYRFTAVEGVAGTNFSQIFEVHSLGDTNLKSQTLSTTAEQASPELKIIHLNANYAPVLKNIDVSGGLIMHGTTGESVLLLENFANIVFTAQTSSVLDPAFEGTFSISPNPAKDAVPQVNYLLPGNGSYELTVTDLTGKILIRQPIAPTEGHTLLAEKMPAPGLYFVCLWQNGKPVAIQKLVILH